MPQLPSVFELINDPLQNKQEKTPPPPLPRISSSNSLSNPIPNTSPQLAKPRNSNRLSDSNIDYFSYYSPHRQSISSSIESRSRKSSTNQSNVPSSIYRRDSIGNIQSSRQNSISHGMGESHSSTLGGHKIANIPSINPMPSVNPVQGSSQVYSQPGAPQASQPSMGGQNNEHFLSNRSTSLPHAPVVYHGPDYYGSVQGASQSRQGYYPNNQHSQGASPPKGSLSYPTHTSPSFQHPNQPEAYPNQQINFTHPIYGQGQPGPAGVPGLPNSGQQAFNGGYDYQMMPYSVQQPVYYPVYSQVPYQVEENNALVNKRRIIKRRTRTGCLTCRKRRIKCDERKPYCFNCERSKKVCLGYENLSKLRKKSKPESDSNSNDDDDEKN